LLKKNTNRKSFALFRKVQMQAELFQINLDGRILVIYHCATGFFFEQAFSAAK